MSARESLYPRDWFTKAQQDIQAVRILMWGQAEAELIGFHLQQAVEKYLKGYLLHRGWKLERLHNLEALLNQVIRYDGDFERFRDLCEEATDFYTFDRYPFLNRPGVTRDDIAVLLSWLNDLVAKIESCVPGSILHLPVPALVRPSAAENWRAQLLQWAPPPPEDPPANASPTDGWRPFADRFRAINQTVRGREEPFLRFLRPWLGSEVSVMDVGAGGGRFTLPLAERVGRVTAVEPSEGMRAVLTEAAQERGLANVEIDAGRWPEVQPDLSPADVVVCSNVLYDVPDLAPFIQALDQAARQRVAIFLTLTHPVGAMSALWRRFRGWETPAGPTYLDAAQVAFALGIAVNITLVPVEPTLVFPHWEAALAMYRQRLGLRPDPARDAELQALLAEMVDEADGRLTVRPRERQAAVIWWEKR